MNYRTDYEFEDNNKQPNKLIAFIVIAWIVIMLIGFGSMVSSCKAPKQATTQEKIQKMQPSKTFVYDKNEIDEVMPKRKD